MTPRRFVPVAILAPLALGWITFHRLSAGSQNAHFELIVFTLSSMACAGLAIWGCETVFNRAERLRSRAEEALRDTEKKREAVFEKAETGDWTWDLQKDEVTAHSLVWKLFGAPRHPGSVPIAWFESRVFPEDAAAAKREYAAAIAQHRLLDIELRAVHPDRSIHWLCSRAAPVYGGTGEVIGLSGITFDITLRKLAEIESKETETPLRRLADAMPQIVWIARRDGTIRYCNQRWQKYSGEGLGSSWQESLHPDDAEFCRRAWSESLTKGTYLEVETRLRRAGDGGYRWHLTRAVPVCNALGKVEQWFGTCTDIDDFKHASSELRTLKKSLETLTLERASQLAETPVAFRLLVEGIQDFAIFMLDAEGKVKTWNAGAERIKQYKSSEVLGKHFSVFYTPEAIASGHPQRELETAISEGQYQEEGWRVRKDQTQFWASVLIAPIYDVQGATHGFSKIIRDLTEQKRSEQLLTSAQKRAEDANRAKSSFLAAMSHEIRTPMNAILGLADLLWETELSQVQREYVGRFRRAGTNLLSLINDILDLSKIESGQFELESVEFSLSELLERTQELMAPRATMKNVEVTVQLAAGTHDLLIGDPFRLQQILNNIVANAIKFTERGKVSLAVEDHSDHVPGHLSFAVSDTGIGIPADKLPSIFEDFTQAESSTTRRFGGTGLGLGICRRLVNRMGGELTAASEFGKGSTFAFDIFVRAIERVAEVDTKEVVDFTGRRVVVVDDNPTNRLILVEMCAGWGMIMVEAATAFEAFELVSAGMLKGTKFALVLLDGVMPGMGGMQALEKLLAIDPDLQIILMSSDNQPGDMTKARALGAAAYVTKPVRRADLLATITNALRYERGHRLSPETGQKSQAGQRSLEILIAEDSEDNRFLLAAYLANKTYKLTFAENGQLALDTFAARKFDLVLMDMQMPVMDGLTATAAIRDLERERSMNPTPIVALTANALMEDVERSQAAGCNYHLSKPISKDKLVSVIESFRVGSSLPESVPQEMPREKPAINIPEGFEALSRNYIASRRKEVSRLMELPPDQGFDELRVFGHNMKGTGTSFGFPGLTTLGAAIEKAAKASNAAELTRYLLEVNQYVELASEGL